MKISSIIAALFCFVSACNSGRVPEFTKLDENVEHLMRKYIAAHPEYDSFILYTLDPLHDSHQRMNSSGMVFGQFTNNMRGAAGECGYQFCIKMDGKWIYVTSYPGYAIRCTPRIESEVTVIDRHPSYEKLDTLILTESDPWKMMPVRFYVPGIYFEYRDGKICNISDRPDTVLHGNPYPEIPAYTKQDKLPVPACETERNDSDYEVIRPKMEIHPLLQDSIKRNMARYPECNTFVLVRAPRFTRTGETRHAPEYLFGPASDSILNHRNLDCYQDFGDKRVFLLSEIFDVFESEPSRWKNRNPKESVVLDDGTVVKDSWDLFLLRSTLYEVRSSDNFSINGLIYQTPSYWGIKVNHRPDTLFFSGTFPAEK